MTSEEIEQRFSYHPPKNTDTRTLHEEVRGRLMDVAQWMDRSLPANMSREKALVITKLEEAMFWANAAIARNPENV